MLLRKLHLLAFTGLVFAAAPASAGEPLLYLSPVGPLMIDVEIRIDGETSSERRRTFARRYFQQIDRDNSGVLEGEELRQIPTLEEWRKSIGEDLEDAPFSSRAVAPQSDGKVTFEEWADYLRRGVAEDRFQITADFPQPVSQETPLFQDLDHNQDGKLSAEEFTLTSSLKKLDFDDDETLHRREILRAGEIALGGYIGYYRSGFYAGDSYFNDPKIPFRLPRHGSSTQLLGSLLKRYDQGEKDRRLSPEELGRTEQAPGGFFLKSDRDGDGRLDFEELRQWLRRPAPAIRVTLRVGERKNSEPAVDIEVLEKELRKQTSVSLKEDRAVLTMGKIQLEFLSVYDSHAFLASGYRNQFEKLDKDDNGSLDAAEVLEVKIEQGGPMFFRIMDADQDGKVSRQEFVSHCANVAESVSIERVFRLSNSGKKLFDFLDRNDDKRLTPREIAAGRKRIADWDENSDRAVEKSEIPRKWRVGATRQTSARERRYVANEFVQREEEQEEAVVAQTPKSADAPRWFRGMDSNNNGEITPREFLGRTADFAKMDSNQDGFIDVEEAARAR